MVRTLYVLYMIAGVIAVIAALIPDLDHPKGYLSTGRNWYLIHLAIRRTTTHRRWTHSLLGSVIFTIAVFPIALVWGAPLNIIPFFIGYLSHLVSDSLNPTGVNWFYPKKKTYGLKLIRTGSKREEYFQKIILVALVGLWLYDGLYNGGSLFRGP